MSITPSRSQWFFALIACAGIAVEAESAPAAGVAAPAGWTPFMQLFDAASQADGIVGAGVVLVHDGNVIAHHEFGFADRERHVRTTPRTIYHYGSITKTLTAVSVMQLEQQGRLTLGDRITRYVPELRQVHDSFGSIDDITLRMLMSHSAGFQDPTWPYTQGKPWEPFEPTTWNQLVAMMPYQELLFAPGSRYGYSNPGFIYLARVIEALSGDAWATYVQKNIFNPLGMTHSYFGITPPYLAADRSHNYTRRKDPDGRETIVDNGAEFDPGITMPNGGWNAPLGDLALWLGFLGNATHGDAATAKLHQSILPRATLIGMWKPLYHVTGDASTLNEAVGLSFFTAKVGGGKIIGHQGNQAGFLAFMYLNQQTGDGIVAAFNTDSDLPPGEQPRAFDRIAEQGLRLIQ